MTKKEQIYKCNVCGNIVEVLHPGAGELVCCGQPMDLMVAQKKDKGSEKHVPVIEGSSVKIGKEEHPSLEEHYIEWIEVMTDEGVCKRFLEPGDRPVIDVSGSVTRVRAYCNIHGLWES